MSNLNFPSNPTIGQQHTVGSKTYTWNGNAWIVSSNTVNGTTGTLQQLIVTNTGSFQQIVVTGTNAAINSTTGALTVAGGVGIQGDVYIGGLLSVEGQIILTTSSFNVDISEGNDIDIAVDPINNNLVIISNISTLESVTGRGNSTTNKLVVLNTEESISTTTGALVVSGGIGIWGNGWFEGRVTSESLRIADAVLDSTVINITNNATVVIDTYSLNDYRAAKYFIQISEGTGPTAEFQAQEITLIASNTGTVDISIYGTVTTNGPNGLGLFDAIVDGTDVKLRFTPDYATNKTVKVLRTAITV